MINFLQIKNYKNLKNLELESLEKVNLVIGKNNTGKSSLLEAISLFITNGKYAQIDKILKNRDLQLNNIFENNFYAIATLFNNFKIKFDVSNIIEITNKTDSIRLKFVKYIETEVDDGNKLKVLVNDNETSDNEFKIGFSVEKNQKKIIYAIERRLIYISDNKENIQYINSRDFNIKNGLLFDSIALTEKENYVIETLQILEPNIERLTFVEIQNERKAVIKLKNNDKITPLSSMGDGINRIFSIILALVNSENGYLLIDEFENGLHYSVQEKLWEIIFYLSEKLNIQVFATTHSNDCIDSFENVLNNSKKNKGKIIKLELYKGDVKEVSYNASELKIATEQNIEIR